MRSPNRWSCLPCSFAYVLDCDLQDIINFVGHDGSDIIFPDLSEPLRRRAFHIQEMLDFCYSKSYVVTPIEARPIGGVDDRHKFLLRADYVSRLQSYMGSSKGVLTGIGKNGTPHAVASKYSTQTIYNPANDDCENIESFGIQTYWMLTRLDYDPKIF